MTRVWKSAAERIAIFLMLAGIVGMCQPFALALFHYGFLVLLFSTLAYIVLSHL
jgi:hypothetical protein